MAWIEVHQSLPGHKKTMKCAEALDIPEVYLVGHLVTLWLWALDNSTDGSLADVSNRMIAKAAQWAGDASTFVHALIGAGYLDRTEEGLYIHDWWEYAGKLLSQRERNREKQQRYRDKQKEPDDTLPESNRDITVTATSHNPSTVPNSTVPNQTKEESKQAPPVFDREPTDDELKNLTFEIYGTSLQAYQEVATHIRATSRIAVAEAMRDAIADAKGPPRSYYEAIIRNWSRQKVKTFEDVERARAQFDMAMDKRGNRASPSRSNGVADMLAQIEAEEAANDRRAS